MGVSGLTTFLREGRNSLATSLVVEQRIQQQDHAADEEGNGKRRQEIEPSEDEIPLVIDAWGFMWGIYPENLRWTTGGEYHAFSNLVTRFLIALETLHCRPYFVFDGPTPASKHETVIQRYAGPLRSSLLFYRTSPQSRSHKSFLAHQPILPPLLLQVFIDTLKSYGLLDGVQVFHLPEGEADAYCVALADELEGLVVGNDSDFAILGARAGVGKEGGYRGYIPIEMIQWQLQIATANSAEQAPTTDLMARNSVDVDDGFQPVKSRRSKPLAQKVTERNQTITTTTSLHLLPPQLPPRQTIADPTTTCTLSLFLTVFTPAALAIRLRIPPSYLPLLATILGTDHSPTLSGGRSLFFEDSLSKRDRVEVAARVIREALSPGNQPRMRKRLATMVGASNRSSTSGRATPATAHGGAVASLTMNAGDEAFTFVALVMGNLLARPISNEETFTEYVTQMIEATCHYILPPSPSSLGLYSDETLATTARPNLGTCCSLFPYCECSPDMAPLSESLPHSSALFDSEETQHLVRRRYALARNAGHMSAFASFVQPDRVYLKSYLQDPQGVCLSGLDVGKRVRAEAWRTLIMNIYLFPVSAPEMETFPEGESVDGGDSMMEESEVAEVVDEMETVLDGRDEASEDGEDFVFEGKTPPSTDEQEENGESAAADQGIWITEYYRTGASQTLGPHDNVLFRGNEPIPPRNAFPVTEDKTLRQARFLQILDTDSTKVAELELQWQFVVAMLRHAVRLQQSSHNGNRKLWTAVEVDRMVEAAVRSSAAWDQNDDTEEPLDNKIPSPLLQNRNADIVAHVTAAALDVLTLSQALLLAEENTAVYRFLEGSTWHTTLEAQPSDTKLSPRQSDIKSAVVAAVTDDFDSRYILGLGTVAPKPPKRERPPSPAPAAPVAKKLSNKSLKGTHGRYDLLMEM
ncbi:hypothetical protein QFC22_001738 [Naganishia vaughanmartiniae]|uniref:Uncharacterized protein n=1 Tax=Naganishia vaughanmartiniae TaxID=1424756 RepID=A0ACC2XEG9_9TREE|nr:hypothetical protein QFC22_001738 [Naganishia vaughanmartiniae]